MKRAKKLNAVCIVLGFAACTFLPSAQSQQANPANFGARASDWSSKAGSTSPEAKPAGSAGVSSWTAGKGSFESSAQLGGVWRDGSTLGTSRNIALDTARAQTLELAAPPTGRYLTSRSISARQASAGGSSAWGTGHFAHAPVGLNSRIAAQGRGSTSGVSTRKFVPSISRGRISSFSRSNRPGEARESTRTRDKNGIATRLIPETPRGALTRESEPSSLLLLTPETRVRNTHLGPEQ
jgi:hypothetical protein